jgi:hypothetical protein
MIILLIEAGLGNRFFLMANCIALGEATGHHVFCPDFPESGKYFGGKHGAFCVWPKSSFPQIRWPHLARRIYNGISRRVIAILQKYDLKLVKIIPALPRQVEKINVENLELLQTLRSHRLVIFTGYPTIENIVLPNPQTVISFFTPREEIAEVGRKIVLKAKGDADILVGVHFRWGDYRTYYNGCFYYPLEAYLRVMRHFAGLFPGKRVAFLLVSNEPHVLEENRAAFASLEVNLDPHTVMGDLHGLAGCDYIISPASSLSVWAAFIGGIPVWCMRDTISLPELKDMVVPVHRFTGLHPEGAGWTLAQIPEPYQPE